MINSDDAARHCRPVQPWHLIDKKEGNKARHRSSVTFDNVRERSASSFLSLYGGKEKGHSATHIRMCFPYSADSSMRSVMQVIASSTGPISRCAFVILFALSRSRTFPRKPMSF